MKKHNSRFQKSSLRQPAVMLVSFLIAGLMTVGSAIAVNYTITDIGTLGGTGSVANDINDSGQVVGCSHVSESTGSHAFIYSNAMMIDLGTLDWFSSCAIAINDMSQIVGYIKTEGTDIRHAFLYSDGIMTDLGTLGGSSSRATGLNNSGQVVGFSDSSTGWDHAFFYSDGIMTDLGTLGGPHSKAKGINNAGQVVGDSDVGRKGGYHAFLYRSGRMVDIGTFGDTLCYARGINDSGQIVGYTFQMLVPPVYNPFLYSEGTMTKLSIPQGVPNSINNAGQIVGFVTEPYSSDRAYLYTNGEMIYLDDLIPQDSGWVLKRASAINNHGQIVGYGTINGQQHAFLMTPICTYSINSTEASFDSSTGIDSVEVIAQAGCPWSASTDLDWITISAGGTGASSGTVTYTVDANTDTAPRSGVITIAGNEFTVTQRAEAGKGPKGYTFCSREDQRCSFRGTMQVAYGANGTFVYKSFTDGVDCISAIFGDPIPGFSKACYTKGRNCTYTILPISKTFASAGGSGSVAVTAASSKCSWTSANSTSWITVTGNGATGNGAVGYSVSENTSSSARTGTITIAGQSFTISQDGLKQYTLAVAKSGTGSGSVLSSDGKINCGYSCSDVYNAKNTTTLTASADEGSVFSGWSGAGCSGQGSCYVAMNSDLSVTASFARCNISIEPASKTFNDGGGIGSVSVTASPDSCAWTVSSSDEWITITSGGKGTGSGTVNYTVASNTATSQRVGTITIAGQTHSVAQDGIPQYTLAITKAGTGSGIVTSADGGINCGTSCSALYPKGAPVVLTAVPDDGIEFTGWIGGGCSGTGTCPLIMSSSTAVGTIFNKPSPVRLTITHPAQGTTITAPHTLVKGTVTNASGRETGVTVNGIPAVIYNDQFVVNHIPLSEGANTITVSGTDTEGATTSASVTVNAVTTGPYLELTARSEAGVAPFEIALRIDGTFTVTDPVINVEGPTGSEALPGSNPEEYLYRLAVEGLYTFTAQAADPEGGTYQDTIAVVAMNKEQLDLLLKAKWEGLKSQLQTGDVEKALSYISASAQDMYRFNFDLLHDHLQEIAQDMGIITMTDIEGKRAEYELITTQDGAKRSFFIEFVVDTDGIWRINFY